MKIFAYLTKNPEYEQDKITLTSAMQTLNFHVDEVIEEATDNHDGIQRIMTLAQPGDVILVPRFRILAQLPKKEWQELHHTTESGLNVVALNLKSSLRGLSVSNPMEKMASKVVTETMMELAENVITFVQNNPEFAKRKTKTGSAAGRPVDEDLHHRISLLLLSGASYSVIQKTENCGRSTIARVKQAMNKLQQD